MTADDIRRLIGHELLDMPYDEFALNMQQMLYNALHIDSPLLRENHQMRCKLFNLVKTIYEEEVRKVAYKYADDIGRGILQDIFSESLLDATLKRRLDK